MSDIDRIEELEAQLAELRKQLAERTRGGEVLQRQSEAARFEVQHRMRNLLASVRAIASQTAEHANSVEDYIAHFDGRLSALARCQSMLNRGEDARADLEELVREEFLSQAIDRTAKISIEGPSLRLDARTAEAMALALHELTTNAAKFGALSHGRGQLSVLWSRSDGDMVFDWTESGAVSPVRAEHNGFGRRYIEQGLPFQLGAKTLLEFNSDGVHSRIQTPIAGTASGYAP